MSFLKLLDIGAMEGRVIGKLVLYLAVSVDGYLADEQGVSWLGTIIFWNGPITELADKLKWEYMGKT